MNGFKLLHVVRTMSRNAVLWVFAALASPSVAMAVPPIITSTPPGSFISTTMFGYEFTFNVVEAGFVSGGFPPREIIGIPVASGGDGEITVSRVGRLCLRVNIGQTDSNFSITFQVAGIDGSQSAPGTLSFTQGNPQTWINPTNCGDPSNLAPQPADFSRSTDPSTPVVINVVTEAPPSIDEYPPALTIASFTQPSQGLVQVNGQVITFTPAGDGTFDFEYSLNDGELNSVTPGRITVIVNPAGVPPVTADTANTGINEPVLIDVLQNDDDSIEGIAAVAATETGLAGNLTSTSTQQGGTAEIVTGGVRGQQILYTPQSGFSGTDQFVYRADGGGVASVTVSVGAGGPSDRTIEAETDPGTAVVISLFGTGASLTAIDFLSPGPRFGTADITDAGRTITYEPRPEISGTVDDFLVIVSDGDPSTADATYAIRVRIASAGPNLEAFGRNPTQRAVGAAIDVVCPALNERAESGTLPTASSQLLNRCSALVEQGDNELDGTAPDGGVSDALQQIAGDEMLAQGTSAVQIANLQTTNIASRIAALRGGSSGVSLGGLALSIHGKQLPNAIMSSVSPDSAKMSGGASGDDTTPWSRLGMFLNGRWNFGDKDETDLESGFDYDTYGLTGGVDYRFADNLILGFALGYTDASADFNRNGGNLDATAWDATAYGTWYADALYVDFSVGFGNVDFDATRRLQFADNRGGVNSDTKGSTDGDSFKYFVSTGYNFASGPWIIGPFVSFDYLKLDVDGFEESGGDGWALAYDKQTVKSRIATGGARISYTVSTSWGVLIPHLRAEFKKELEDNTRTVRARFVLDPDNTIFEFSGDDPDTSFYTWAAGFSFVTPYGFSGFLDYESLAGYDNLTSNTVTAGIRFQRAFR